MSAVKQVLVVIGTGFEEVETLAPIDVLVRAGAKVSIASIEEELLCKGKGGVHVKADCFITEVDSREFEVIIIPGGPQFIHMRLDKRVHALLNQFKACQKLICSICAGPLVLLDADVLPELYTAFPTTADELPHIIQKPIVFDGTANVITAPGPGAAMLFGLRIVEEVFGIETRTMVEEQIFHYE